MRQIAREYAGQSVQEILDEHVTVQIAERSKVMPKHSVLERSFAWLDKNTRLRKNCERLVNTSLQFVHLAFLAQQSLVAGVLLRGPWRYFSPARS